MSAALRSRRLPLIPACLAAIILGILGMHALDHHASMPPHEDGHQPVTSVVTAGLSAGFSTGQVTSAAVPDDQSTTHQFSVCAAMLCAAMLVGAAGGALLALGLRRPATGGLCLKRLREVSAGIVTSRLGNGPPYVWKFSVVRC